MKWRNGLGMDDGAGLAICIIMQQTNISFIIFDTHLTNQYPMHDHVYMRHITLCCMISLSLCNNNIPSSDYWQGILCLLCDLVAGG